ANSSSIALAMGSGTYKPDLIGFSQLIFIYSFTVIRLAFQAYKMKYTSTTWVVASALEGFLE
ncbi:hypothetical protein, partial [Citrobacter freundii]|uniref:hypothetical protein n=1 Tax=Citrobacter freundii TaxID=546 RepID=UPI0013D25F55